MSAPARSPVTAAATLLLLALAALLARPTPGAAQTAGGGQNVYAITSANQLVRFDSAAPSSVSAPMAISGLQDGESILGIDIRPATGELYGLGSTSRLYVLDPATGAATAIGSGAFAIPLSGTDFGFDFNPTVDRIRVVSDAGQNLRIHPVTGAVVDTDAGSPGVQPDGAINGAATGLVASGYTTNFATAATTTLYGIDAAGDQLVVQSPPNNGATVAVGPLGLDAGGAAGMDIVGAGNQAFAALTPAAASATGWYAVNLTTGAATEIGSLGIIVRAVAVVPPPAETVWALTASGKLVAFQSSAPGTLTASLAVSGLPAGESLTGIDFRPADGRLYAVSSASQLYTIDTISGAAAMVGTAPLTPTLSGAAVGFDFNPLADRLRIVTDADQNLRVNPTSSAAIVDGALAFGAGDPNAAANPSVAAAGYTNNISGTTSTQLFVIDSALDVLALQNPPNNGTLTTVGPLGVDVSDQLGMDISRSGGAFVSFTAPAGATSSFGTISTGSGAIASLGTIGGGEVILDIAIPTWPTMRYLPVINP